MIYDISCIVQQCMDEETGEIDSNKLDALIMERDKKIENLALWEKDLQAEADAIEKESRSLKERAETTRRKAESIKSYLTTALHGEKFKTPRCSVSYRKSVAVDISPECNLSELTGRFKTEIVEIKPNKKAMKEYLQNGGKIDGVSLAEKQNIQIR